MADSRGKPKIHILYEPFKDSSVFLAKTGEALSLPETILYLDNFWSKDQEKTGLLSPDLTCRLSPALMCIIIIIIYGKILLLALENADINNIGGKINAGST